MDDERHEFEQAVLVDAVRRGERLVLLAGQMPLEFRHARSRAVLEDPRDLHDPDGVSAACLVAVGVLQL